MSTGAEALHFNCVACRAASEGDGGEIATLSILVMIHDDCTPEAIHRDLCFTHRRRVEDAVAKAKAER
jgi:hypothetical protein